MSASSTQLPSAANTNDVFSSGRSDDTENLEASVKKFINSLSESNQLQRWKEFLQTLGFAAAVTAYASAQDMEDWLLTILRQPKAYNHDLNWFGPDRIGDDRLFIVLVISFYTAGIVRGILGIKGSFDENDDKILREELLQIVDSAPSNPIIIPRRETAATTTNKELNTLKPWSLKQLKPLQTEATAEKKQKRDAKVNAYLADKEIEHVDKQTALKSFLHYYSFLDIITRVEEEDINQLCEQASRYLLLNNETKSAFETSLESNIRELQILQEVHQCFHEKHFFQSLAEKRLRNRLKSANKSGLRDTYEDYAKNYRENRVLLEQNIKSKFQDIKNLIFPREENQPALINPLNPIHRGKQKVEKIIGNPIDLEIQRYHGTWRVGIKKQVNTDSTAAPSPATESPDVQDGEGTASNTPKKKKPWSFTGLIHQYLVDETSDNPIYPVVKGGLAFWNFFSRISLAYWPIAMVTTYVYDLPITSFGPWGVVAIFGSAIVLPTIFLIYDLINVKNKEKKPVENPTIEDLTAGTRDKKEFYDIYAKLGTSLPYLRMRKKLKDKYNEIESIIDQSLNEKDKVNIRIKYEVQTRNRIFSSLTGNDPRRLLPGGDRELKSVPHTLTAFLEKINLNKSKQKEEFLKKLNNNTEKSTPDNLPHEMNPGWIPPIRLGLKFLTTSFGIFAMTFFSAWPIQDFLTTLHIAAYGPTGLIIVLTLCWSIAIFTAIKRCATENEKIKEENTLAKENEIILHKIYSQRQRRESLIALEKAHQNAIEAKAREIRNTIRILTDTINKQGKAADVNLISRRDSLQKIVDALPTEIDKIEKFDEKEDLLQHLNTEKEAKTSSKIKDIIIAAVYTLYVAIAGAGTGSLSMRALFQLGSIAAGAVIIILMPQFYPLIGILVATIVLASKLAEMQQAKALAKKNNLVENAKTQLQILKDRNHTQTKKLFMQERILNKLDKLDLDPITSQDHSPKNGQSPVDVTEPKPAHNPNSEEGKGVHPEKYDATQPSIASKDDGNDTIQELLPHQQNTIDISYKKIQRGQEVYKKVYEKKMREKITLADPTFFNPPPVRETRCANTEVTHRHIAPSRGIEVR